MPNYAQRAYGTLPRIGNRHGPARIRARFLVRSWDFGGGQRLPLGGISHLLKPDDFLVDSGGRALLESGHHWGVGPSPDNPHPFRGAASENRERVALVALFRPSVFN